MICKLFSLLDRNGCNGADDDDDATGYRPIKHRLQYLQTTSTGETKVVIQLSSV